MKNLNKRSLNKWLDECEAKAAEMQNKFPDFDWWRVSEDINKLRKSVVSKNIELAVLQAIDLASLFETINSGESIDICIERHTSFMGKRAANVRHKLPMPKVKALKKEYTKVHKLLTEEKGEEPRPTTVYKEISNLLWHTKKHWRRIRTQVQKDTKK